MSWIVVPNWPKFQHYHDRNPTWIKLYAALAYKDEWLSLTWAERGLLVSIWLAYAQANGEIRTSNLHALTNQRVFKRHLERLSDAGFIEFSASKPLALARAREETEREREKKITKRKPDKGRRRAEAWIKNGLAVEVPPEALADVISDEFGITDPDLIYELTQKAIERKVTP